MEESNTCNIFLLTAHPPESAAIFFLNCTKLRELTSTSRARVDSSSTSINISVNKSHASGKEAQLERVEVENRQSKCETLFHSPSPKG